MENPVDPGGGQYPTPDNDHLDDPLLDALERSIQQGPPGFVDPLAESEALPPDPLAQKLDAVEADIEGAPALPDSAVIPDLEESGLADEEVLPEDTLPAEYEDGNMAGENGRDEDDRQPGSRLPSGQDGSRVMTRHPNLLAPPGGRSNVGTYRGSRQTGGPVGRSTGARAPAARITRICPQTHELIDSDQCQSCEKYRHWPEGSDEEPRECWYDYQSALPDRMPPDQEDEQY